MTFQGIIRPFWIMTDASVLAKLLKSFSPFFLVLLLFLVCPLSRWNMDGDSFRKVNTFLDG